MTDYSLMDKTMNQVYILKHWSSWEDSQYISRYDESVICYFLNKPNKLNLSNQLCESFNEYFTIEDLLENETVCISHDDKNSEGYFFEVEDLH